MTVTKINAPLLAIQCPAFMRNIPGWLVWRLEKHEGEEKARKVPYYAGGGRRVGRQGTEADRERLVTFDAALAVAARKNFDGVGFAPLPGFDVTGLDWDNVVGSPWQDEVEEMVLGTYAEFSPSGKGIRAFIRGMLPNRKSHAGDKWPYTFETFGSKGFVTFTGMQLPQNEFAGDDVGQGSPELRALIAQRFVERSEVSGTGHTEAVVGLSEAQLQTILDALDPSMAHDDWLYVGMALHHETRGEGFELFDAWSSGGAQYPGREALGARWESFGNNVERSITGRYLLKVGAAAGVSVGGPVASVDDFDVIDTPPEDTAAKGGRFEVVPVGAFSRRPPPEWIVEDLLPEAQLVVLYGPSGAGKSFILLDLVMAVARGVPWRGLETRQRRVVYIVAEGGGGFVGRVKAYGLHHEVDLDAVPLGIINAVPNFLQRQDITDLQAAIAAAEGAGLIVVDTFAKTTAGSDENSGKDMGQALDNCRRISEATGAMVVLVHHAGKDVSRGSRGWSGIRAAADAEFEVVHNKDTGARWLETTKQKDGRDDGKWGFKLVDVTVHTDARGKARTSAVAVPDAIPDGGRDAKRAKAQGTWQTAVMEAIAIFELADDDIMLPDLIAKAIELRPSEGGKLMKRQDNIHRAIEGLIKKKLISVRAPFVFRVEE